MRALLAACLVAAGAGRAAAGAAPAALGVGAPVHGTVAAGETRVYRLDVPPGHVVQGSFDGQDARLDLQDAQGRHLRRFGAAQAAAQGFMWVARGPGEERLAVSATGAAGGRFSLRLARTLAPAAPPAPGEAASPDSPRLRALQRTLAEGGGTEAFWQEMARQGTPLVEPLPGGHSLVTFLWRGARGNVRLFGSPSGDHDPLQRLAGSDVWWATFRMPDTARLSYRLAPDVPRVQGTALDQRRVILATAQRDPLNRRVYPPGDAQAEDAFQGYSVLELPAAPPQPWVARRDGVPAGDLQRHRVASRILGNERDVWLYRPAGAAPQALLVAFDAHTFVSQVPTPVIVDNLHADGLIPPTAVVLVGNASPQARGAELPPNPRFAAFLDQELMPWVRAQGLALPATRTVIGGASYGGLASAYAGLVNPHWFGHVLSLSGSYWWSPEGAMPGWTMRRFAEAPRRDVRFYLDAGRYEGARGGQDGILETSRHLGDVLRAKGYAVTQVEHDTGHDHLHWQGSLGCGLVALLNPERFAGLAACAGQAPAQGEGIAR